MPPPHADGRPGAGTTGAGLVLKWIWLVVRHLLQRLHGIRLDADCVWRVVHLAGEPDSVLRPT